MFSIKTRVGKAKQHRSISKPKGCSERLVILIKKWTNHFGALENFLHADGVSLLNTFFGFQRNVGHKDTEAMSFSFYVSWAIPLATMSLRWTEVQILITAMGLPMGTAMFLKAAMMSSKTSKSEKSD